MTPCLKICVLWKIRYHQGIFEIRVGGYTVILQVKKPRLIKISPNQIKIIIIIQIIKFNCIGSVAARLPHNLYIFKCTGNEFKMGYPIFKNMAFVIGQSPRNITNEIIHISIGINICNGRNDELTAINRQVINIHQLSSDQLKYTIFI